jgi:Zinc carboxypeptidase
LIFLRLVELLLNVWKGIKMKKLGTPFVFIVMFVSLCTASIDPDIIVKINFSDKNLAFVKLHPLHLAYEDVQSTWARAAIKPHQLDKIQSMGFKVDVLYEDSRIRAEERRAAMRARDWYTDYPDMVTELLQTEIDHPDIVRLFVVGQSILGRDIYAMKITDNPDDNEIDEVEVRMAGNIHGDEFMSMELMRLLIEYLTDNYGTDPTVTDLVDNREIWVQPSINPDGHEAGTRSNSNGVDMNRNHGYMWSYGGSGPFSEQELQVFRAYSLERNFSMSLSFHGETTYFNYCWNFTGESAFDKTHLHALGSQYVTWNGYTNTEGYDWYQTNGDTNDWSYGCRGDFDVTIETPGYSGSAIPVDWADNRDAMLYIIDQAAYGLSGVITDANSGLPVEALVTVHQHPIMVYTDPVAGDYHRPLQAGTYDITVWANGYQPAIVTGISVSTEMITIQDVSLVPNYEHYAMHVCWNIIDDYYENYTGPYPDAWHEGYPHLALGPPDDVPGSLGRNCTVAYDMGEGYEISDLPGADFVVYEADVGDGDEGFSMYVSSDGFLGPWVLVGNGSGTTEFDLAGTGLDMVRYLKIEDDDDGDYDSAYPGYDLDAIGSIEIVAGCGIISLDDTTYPCDEYTVLITVIDEDLNSDPGTQEITDIVIESDSNPDGEMVTLTEIGMDSDTFEGSIIISEEYSGGGYLLVDRGDTITATYDDADCEGSPRTVIDTAIADCSDPQLVFSSCVVDDSTGDSDGIIDPGETVFLIVTVDNIGDETASGVYADLMSDSPAYITIDDGTANFPDIPAGENGVTQPPHFQVTASPDTPDHTIVTFTMTLYSTDSEDESPFQTEVTTSTFSRRYIWNMDTDPGWSADPEWEWGVPEGNEGDPSSGYTGTTVYGYDLSGEYANNLPEKYLTTDSINCSHLEDVEVRFMRWLGVEDAQWDHASFEISTNGSSWSTIWEHDTDDVVDTSWQAMEYDISSYADGEETVYLRWVMGTTDSSVTFFGWNVDDVEIWGASGEPNPTFTPVPTATPAPPTDTPVPPTDTPVPSTNTPAPPTDTPVQPTDTPVPPTDTPAPPTDTPVPPTDTPVPPTDTPVPPTDTPVPSTNTPVPPTETPVPGEFEFSLGLNQEFYRPWDHFLLTTYIVNPDETMDVNEFIMLDVYNNYWFWPSWSEAVDFEARMLPANMMEEESILDFWWPAGVGSGNNIRFWGALLDPATSALIGNYDMVEFSYGN